MKLEPVGLLMTGFAMLHKKPGPESVIIDLQDPAKNTSRCFLVEGAGPEARAAGYAPGDILVLKSVRDVVFYGGDYHRALFAVDEVVMRVHGTTLDEYTDLKGVPIVNSLPEELGGIAAPFGGNGALSPEAVAPS